jgi:hypothetical protein
MKTILSLILALCSFQSFVAPASANSEVVAFMKFDRVNDFKLFGVHWFEKQQVGMISLGLLWGRYTTEVKEGFQLSKAQSVTFVSPAMLEGCQVQSFKGELTSEEYGSSAVNLTLAGSSCKDLLQSLGKSQIEILFTNVPSLAGSSITDSLRLNLIETAY